MITVPSPDPTTTCVNFVPKNTRGQSPCEHIFSPQPLTLRLMSFKSWGLLNVNMVVKGIPFPSILDVAGENIIQGRIPHHRKMGCADLHRYFLLALLHIGTVYTENSRLHLPSVVEPCEDFQLLVIAQHVLSRVPTGIHRMVNPV